MNMQIDFTQAKAILELTLAQFSVTYAAFHAAVYDAVDGYLSHVDVSGRTKMKTAIAFAAGATAAIAWQDGGQDLPFDAETDVLLAGWITAQQGHAGALFDRLALLRKELTQNKTADAALIAIREARARADGYSSSLKYLYAIVKVMALGNEKLLFGGLPGHESCPECTMLMDTVHTARYYVAHGYVPPNGDGLSCADGGQCEHILISVKTGQLVTI